MMKLIYVLMFFALLSGCKVKRNLSVQTEQKFEQTERRDVHESETNVRDSSGQKITEIVSNKESDSETETTVKTTEYDTSKPINPVTGKHPILKETEAETRIKKKDKEGAYGKQTDNNHVSGQSGKSKIDSSTSHMHEKISAKADQSNIKTSFSVPWLWIIICIGVVICVSYCVNKKINPFKWLYNNIVVF